MACLTVIVTERPEPEPPDRRRPPSSFDCENADEWGEWVLDHGLPAVETACAEALEAGIASGDVILTVLARRRQHVECAVPLRDDEPELGDHRESTLSGTPLTLDQQRHFWIDIERALLSLPPVLLETAYALCWYTPSELSLVLGRSRTIIYQRIRRLRGVLLEAGIGADYFTTGRRAQLRSLPLKCGESPSHAGAKTNVRAKTNADSIRPLNALTQRMACHAQPDLRPTILWNEVRG